MKGVEAVTEQDWLDVLGDHLAAELRAATGIEVTPRERLLMTFASSLSYMECAGRGPFSLIVAYELRSSAKALSSLAADALLGKPVNST